MSGTTPLLPAYAVMSWTTTVPLLRSDRTRGTKRNVFRLDTKRSQMFLRNPRKLQPKQILQLVQTRYVSIQSLRWSRFDYNQLSCLKIQDWTTRILKAWLQVYSGSLPMKCYRISRTRFTALRKKRRQGTSMWNNLLDASSWNRKNLKR